jgi:hypothetical protein
MAVVWAFTNSEKWGSILVKLKNTRINFSILKWRSIVIAAIVALLVISTQFWFGSMKEDKNTHYLKTMGSCQQPTTIKIYDETGGVEPFSAWGLEEDSVWPFMWRQQEESRSVKSYFTSPVNIIKHKYFKKYINTISRYVFAKVDAMGQCQGTAGLPQVELVFVYRPALSSGIVPFKDFTNSKSKFQATKQLDSPWVKLTLARSPQLNLKAVFIWSERQFLLDQALILGERSWDSRPPMPIALEIFDRWESDDPDPATPSQEASFARQLPADMRWLFKNARLSGLPNAVVGEVRSGLKFIMEQNDKPGYTDLNIALINQLFNDSKQQIHYDSVLDLKDLFDIDKYQIRSIHT